MVFFRIGALTKILKTNFDGATPRRTLTYHLADIRCEIFPSLELRFCVLRHLIQARPWSIRRSRMTGNDYRDLKIGELRAALQELEDIAVSTYSPDTKERVLRNVQRRMHDLTALLLSPALAAICEARKGNGNSPGYRDATEMDFR
jgi:hypothetical protein